MIEKRGIVSEIIYRNKDDGYSIIVIENEESLEQLTAVGYLPNVDKGREFTLIGKWRIHPTYGEQFAFESYRKRFLALQME